jgi:hypothetical protein
MGKPDSLDGYVPIQVGEWGRRYGTIYVLRQVWDRQRPVSCEFTFYVQSVGRLRLQFDMPIGRLQP